MDKLIKILYEVDCGNRYTNIRVAFSKISRMRELQQNLSTNDMEDRVHNFVIKYRKF